MRRASSRPSRMRTTRCAAARHLGGMRGQQDRDAEVAVQLGAAARARWRRCPSRGCRSARRRRPAPAGAPARGRWPRAAPRRPTPAADSGRGDGAMPTRSARSRGARLGVGRRPCRPSRQGSAMLSPRVSVGSRLKNWKTKPMRSRRRRVRSSSSRPARSRPSMARRPAVGRSIAPHRCSSVDLPQPDGPISATKSPGSRVSDTPRRAVTGAAPPV